MTTSTLLSLPSHTARDESPLAIARRLATEFAPSAVERDARGGTPKEQRDALRASGLLALSIPRELGGMGASWRETLDVVRELARVDASVAHVFGFHHLMLATVRLFARPAQYRPWFEHTARLNWFWGNALNPLDSRTVSRRFNGWREFSGQKSFCSGAIDSEMLIASAMDDKTQQMVIAALPTVRTGITLIEDWNNIGQRQTDSGSVNFERVRVDDNDVLDDPGPLSTPQSCLRPLIAQSILTHVYLGIAEGAFDEARNYTLNEARPWHTSNQRNMGEDPYVLGHYGDFWLGLEGARALAQSASDQLDAVWAEGDALTEQGRGEAAIKIATAKVAATRVGLDLSSRMFDVTGSRATHAELGFDRYWRNLRTYTLHDPVDYKVRELGEWALTAKYPTPTFYS